MYYKTAEEHVAFPRLRQVLHLWQKFTGVFGILGLWSLYFVFLIKMTGQLFYLYPFSLFGETPRFIFSGDLFTQSFRIEHAGFVMDQPTIGKYLVIFIFFSLTTFAASIIIRLVSNLKSMPNRLAFGTALILSVFWLFSALSWPTVLLAHYIIDMGWTLTRLAGIIFIMLSCLALIVWPYLLLRPKKSPL